jgi:hypothetical protein
MKVYTMRPHISILLIGLLLLARPVTGRCWGDEGHEIVGRIAAHYLKPQVRARVAAILATDKTGLTRSTGIAEETTWADKFRDSDRDTTRIRYGQTNQWHFIDIEIDAPDVDAACFQHPPLPPDGNASEGPAADCILDKIDAFAAELHSRKTSPDERRLALLYLLHFVGDLHQPLHAADHHDRGGNDVRVKAADEPAGNLHHYWDSVFVRRLGAHSDDVARRLIAQISSRERRDWSSGSTKDWTEQSFEIGKSHVYGRLAAAAAPAGSDIALDDAYMIDAERIVEMQLQRAGLRLARLLNRALST